MNRRDFLVSTSGMLLAPVPSFAKQDSTQALVDQALRAQGKGDWVTMERLLREAIAAGRTDEGVLRAFAFALNNQWKFTEAIRVALDNNQRNPGAFSVAGVCETYVNSGDYDNGHKWLKFAKENENQWGQARPLFQNCQSSLEERSYRISYELDPSTLDRIPATDKPVVDFTCPLPFADLPYQKSNYDIRGAKSFREEKAGENSFLRIIPDGSQRITVTLDVTLTPSNFRKRMHPFSPSDVPLSVQPLMKSTPHVEVEDDQVKRISSTLKGSNAIESIENVMRWSHTNLEWKSGPGAADMETDSKLVGGGAAAVLKRRYGHCEGETSGVVALLRALGIPARFVRGNSGIWADAGDLAFHTWTEFYTPSFGWLQWDLNNPPFTVPVKACVGHFRYTSPYGVSPYGKPGSGDADTWNSWFFYTQVMSPGRATYTRIKN